MIQPYFGRSNISFESICPKAITTITSGFISLSDLVQSAIYAAKLRFRPILMTSLAFVLGMLPMVLASGPGSASRQAIGTGVFFGMIFAIVFGIILVPFFFVMVYKTKSKILKHKK